MSRQQLRVARKAGPHNNRVSYKTVDTIKLEELTN